jgi:hypothetical protein
LCGEEIAPPSGLWLASRWQDTTPNARNIYERLIAMIVRFLGVSLLQIAVEVGQASIAIGLAAPKKTKISLWCRASPS